MRTDASVEIVSGNVMRYLVLANLLNKSGYMCEFICREHIGNYVEYIRMKGFKVLTLPFSSKNIISNSAYMSWLSVSELK
ncbi:hypothetical protein OAQ98_01075 [Alphaproteobacteria bacterium]|nr:hypothetical protein [Alphaproteobacteria bacterium]